LSTEKLKETIQKVFPDVETVICWQEGFDKLHTTPLFITAADQTDKSVWNALCAQNLASYLPSQKKKVAVVVKGCDSRTIVQFMEEGLIDRNNVVIIGIPCKGVVSVKRVLKAIDFQPIENVTCADGKVVVKTPKGETTMSGPTSARHASIPRRSFTIISSVTPSHPTNRQRASTKMSVNLRPKRWKNVKHISIRNFQSVSAAMPAVTHAPCASVRTVVLPRHVTLTGLHRRCPLPRRPCSI
jgi:hypothetical protein